MGTGDYTYVNPLAIGEQQRITNPAMDPNYAYYEWRINSANAGRYTSYLKAKKLNDLSNLNDKMNYDKDIADINQYIKYAKQDYIAGLAKTDANMADALQQATESYWAWNLIGSGIQIARTTEMINEEDFAKDELAREKKNTMDKYNDIRGQVMWKYEQITKPINEMNKPKYSPLWKVSRETFAQAPENFIPQ